MYSQQFDGNAAFSGGGFMPSQSTQTAEPGFTSVKNRDSQGLLPLTVKQINGALDSTDEKSNFVVDGVDVNNITMVGMVFNKTGRHTEVVFTLDDGTGKIECHRWLQESIESKEMDEIQDGMYVRVHGHLKGFQGKRQLVAFSVRPVTNFNEIAYHFIECIYVHVYNTKKQKGQGSAQVQTQSGNSAMGLSGSMGLQGSFSNQVSGQYSFDGIQGLDKKVLDFLSQPTFMSIDRGVHKDDIAKQLKVPVDRIMQAINSLEAEGAIYSTIDECHFKSALNG